MSVDIIQRRLDDYRCASREEEDHALREITQEVALAGLGRTDLFKFAAFLGGTCLRIFYGLNRFSEDVDLVLKEPSSTFRIEPYLKNIAQEVSAYGYQMEVSNLSKDDRIVQKAFLKDGSIGRMFHLKHIRADRSMAKIRIKVEVDTNPPSGGKYEVKYLAFPFPAAVTCHDEPSLLAGKLHALLCREYVKGRDWYDLLFYTARRIRPNYALFSSSMKQSGPWEGQQIDFNARWCHEALVKKIRSLDWKAARTDVSSFVRSYERPSLELWGPEFFESQIDFLVSRT